MSKINAVVTHERPHMDEIAAIWILRKFGEEKFPGISKAPIKFWDNGGKIPDGRSADEHELDGTLLIGIGGGRFDEHPVNGERKMDERAATLAAKAVGVDDNPALEKILKFVVNNDLKAAAHPFDIAYLVKFLHQRYPEDAQKVIEWATEGLEAKFQEQFQFWNKTKEEFERIAEIEEIYGPNGRIIKMVTVISDDEQISKFARSPHGANAAVVIQRRLSGNTQIYTNKKFNLFIQDMVQMVRIAEQEANGKVITTNWETLSIEGKIEGAEEWYYHKTGQMLLNGSLTAKSVPPTRLSLERIKNLVRIGINPDAFEPKRARSCEKRKCTSSLANPCPWYNWKLHRCRKVRFATFN